jgi:hypothetical protein
MITNLPNPTNHYFVIYSSSYHKFPNSYVLVYNLPIGTSCQFDLNHNFSILQQLILLTYFFPNIPVLPHC